MGDRIGVQPLLREIYLSLTNHPGQLSMAIPPWVGAMSTGQRAVMLCYWGVKADMVLFAGNTVWSISERVRGVCVDALYKSTFTLLYFTLHCKQFNKEIRCCCCLTLFRELFVMTVNLCSFLWCSDGSLICASHVSVRFESTGSSDWVRWCNISNEWHQENVNQRHLWAFLFTVASDVSVIVGLPACVEIKLMWWMLSGC